MSLVSLTDCDGTINKSSRPPLPCWCARQLSIYTAQLLKQHITGLNRSLGESLTGADWCLKALHPSDPITEVRGIPDHSAAPSICMNYQTTFTLKPPTAGTSTWGFDMALLPHPVNFAWIKSVDSVETDSPLYTTVLNSQLDGATHAGCYESFSNMCERWRLAYASVTVYQDGADLANQGTMVVAQVPSAPRYRNAAGPWEFTTPKVYTYPRLEVWDTDVFSGSLDLPQFEASQGMPNAYFGRSREGAYIPLKLTDTSQDWTSASDEVYWTYALERTRQAIRLPNGVGDPDDVQDLTFPHCAHSSDALPNAYVSINQASTGYSIVGNPTSPMLNGNIAHCCARNLARTTSYSFFFRFGIEMQVKPQSFLAPQMKLSPPYDPVALNAYFAIARELKDAYPADYNDLGKLWDVIKRAATYALPVLARAGPYGKLASSVGTVVLAGGDAIQKMRSDKKLGSDTKPSAADIERLQDAAFKAFSDAAVIRSTRRQNRQKKKSTAGPARARGRK